MLPAGVAAVLQTAESADTPRPRNWSTGHKTQVLDFELRVPRLERGSGPSFYSICLRAGAGGVPGLGYGLRRAERDARDPPASVVLCVTPQQQRA